jgi:large subunit ribosomal protein L6
MSLIGAKPVTIKDGVTVSVNGNMVTVKGPKGELTQALPLEHINVVIADNTVTISRKSESKETKAYHGLVRSIIQNMVTGVSEGFQKKLELIGTGYRVAKQGSKIVLSLGYSHPIDYVAPAGITLDVEGNNIIIVKGSDKQVVGQVSAEIRSKRPPEPYKGKGVKYENEVIRRKAGKTAAA